MNNLKNNFLTKIVKDKINNLEKKLKMDPSMPKEVDGTDILLFEFVKIIILIIMLSCFIYSF